MSQGRRVRLIVPALILILANCVCALVNPSLQPADLFDRSSIVVSFKIDSIDNEHQSAILRVQVIHKGTFDAKTVKLTAVGQQMTEAFFKVLNKDETVTAFVGKPRKPLAFDFYAGAEGRWQGGDIANADKPDEWNWTKDYNQHELFGTFNGQSARLAEMMADKAAGRLFFPATIFDRFKPDKVLAKLSLPIRGVAMFDFNDDGRADVFACTRGGDRLYIQTEPLVFVDRTDEVGLSKACSSSVNVADVNADGLADLLLDGEIWEQNPDHHFVKSDLLPASANANVICSAFVDINNDGYPDVLVSARNRGLSLFLNPGNKGGPFKDVSHASGLDQPGCGAGGTGWISFGDWDNDGRLAIFYTSGTGFLLTQKQEGVFSGTLVPLEYDFTAGDTVSGLTGAGCFAPVWCPDRPDVLFTRDTGLGFVVNKEGHLLDGLSYANEAQMGTLDQLPLIAEDLNADGNVDVYVGSRSGKPNMYYMNRGYGTFMIPDRYKAQVFPGTAHRSGAWGLAAGDIDGDGVNDLLLGGVDGTVTLICNDALSTRQSKDHPTAQEETLEKTSILTVEVKGDLGVIGAKVTLTASDGRIIARRDIGSNVATGCRGPNTVNLAVREPGKYGLLVHFSDGLVQKMPVEMQSAKHAKLLVVRDVAKEKAELK